MAGMGRKLPLVDGRHTRAPSWTIPQISKFPFLQHPCSVIAWWMPVLSLSKRQPQPPFFPVPKACPEPGRRADKADTPQPARGHTSCACTRCGHNFATFRRSASVAKTRPSLRTFANIQTESGRRRIHLPRAALGRRASREDPAASALGGGDLALAVLRPARRLRFRQVGHLQCRRVEPAHEVHRMADARNDDPLGQEPRQGIVAPASVSAAQVRRGFCAYETHCVACHGAAAVARERWVSGMEPAPPYLARRDPEMAPARAVLDRQERDQDDGHAVVAQCDVRRPDLGRRRVAGSEPRPAAADLCAMARRRASVRALSGAPSPGPSPIPPRAPAPPTAATGG